MESCEAQLHLSVIIVETGFLYCFNSDVWASWSSLVQIIKLFSELCNTLFTFEVADVRSCETTYFLILWL